MSVIDQRVVEMRFDNRQFESGVATTMSTLDKFKQSLNLSGATKGLEDVSSAAKRCDMSTLGTAVETVKMKFSALEVMGITALTNITNSAVNAGKRIASALTIDPIKTGFQEYETQINAVQTILANTESKGTTLNDVNSALDTLNTYADKTIYNFTEMTRNIGTFTAAGIDLDTSVNAIQGIANLAAVSGSTSQQASTAMYQLSQALASGTVKLMDWNSVVNAGMGGQVFQDALKETARVHGVAIDDMIDKNGSFRETLHEGWLTSEILTETLEKFTMTTEGLTEAEIAKNREMLKSKGYTDEQIDAIFKLGNTATNAATKVKTFSQLWDTLKEAAQSGWSQTWEIIVGDFEEAKELFTEVSDVIGKMIGDSASARNELLQGWKDAGGRADLIDGIRNAFEGVMNIITPIKEAFRDIFPPLTVKNLTDFTAGFKDLTARFEEFTSSHGEQIKSIFTGIFSVLDIGLSVVKSVTGGIWDLFSSVTGFSGGILDSAAAIGDWLTGLRDSIKETDIFAQAIDKVKGFLTGIIDKVKEFGTSMKDAFSSDNYEGVIGLMKAVWEIVMQVGSAITEVFSALGRGLSEAFTGWNFDAIIDAINGGLITGILLTIKNFTKGIFEAFNGEEGFLANVVGILDDVRGCFRAYQDQLKSSTLLTIASAIGILAASILVISTIDPISLAASTAAIAVLFSQLMTAMSMFTTISKDMRKVLKGTTVMISMSIAILALAGAVKMLSTVDFAGLVKGLVGVGVLMAEMSLFLNNTKFDGKMLGASTGMVLIATSMVILASAVKNFGEMDWGEIGKGLVSIGALLAELAIFTNLTGNASHVLSTGAAMVLLGASMKIFASAVKDFSGMNWDELARGLTGMAGALAAVTIAMNLMPKNMAAQSVGMIAVSSAMLILSNALAGFSGMSWDELARGLVAMGGALLELAIGLNFMNGTLAGSAALLVAAGALALLAPSMRTLGEMSLAEIGTSLLGIAGAFVAFGIAGLVLGPLVPVILGLSAAFALFGISILSIGAGLSLAGVGLSAIATGFTALSVALGAGSAAIVAGLTAIVINLASLIPNVCIKIAEGIVAFAQVIADGAPTIALAIGVLLTEMLNLIITYIPLLVETGLQLLIGLLEGIANNIGKVVETVTLIITNFLSSISTSLPQIIQSGVDLMLNFINGMADSIRSNTPAVIQATNNLVDAIIDAILAYLGNFVTKGAEIVSKIISGIQSMFTDVYNIGCDLISGLVQGIVDNVTSVVDAVVGAVQSAIAAAKSWLGIASPSKVFAEMGMYSDEGLALGFLKYADVVKNAATEVAAGAVDSMSDAVSGMSDVFDSVVDTQPTIRPVLDLSNIQNGANSLSGMFGQQSVALAGIGSSLYNASMNGGFDQFSSNSATSNEDVVNAISELRGDFGSLINAISNMQICMDSGTVVGELIGKIDNSLGQIAIHKGRG